MFFSPITKQTIIRQENKLGLDLSRRRSERNHLFRLGRRRVRLVGPILFTTHKMERKGTWALNSEIKPGLVKTAIKSMKREHDAPRGRNFLASGVERQAILKCAYLSLVSRYTQASQASTHQYYVQTTKVLM